jgi:hypothetical protein
VQHTIKPTAKHSLREMRVVNPIRFPFMSVLIGRVYGTQL